jgi:hypothetical protein
VVRVVLLEEGDGSWRAFLGTDPEATAEAIVQAVLDRWAIETGQADSTSNDRWCAAPGAGYDRRRRAA